MLLHRDVMRAWHRKLAMETQAQTLAVGTGFGGKVEHLERFIDGLVEGHGGERQVADPDAVIAHGETLLDDDAAVEREAEMMARFARRHANTESG